jgi:hypothetical protein
MVLSARQLEERAAGRVPPPSSPAVAAPAVPFTSKKGKDEEEGPLAVLEHPDSTEESPIDCSFTAQLPSGKVKVYLDRGRVETRDPELTAYLLGLGYRKVNNDWPVQEDPAWTAAKARLKESI